MRYLLFFLFISLSIWSCDRKTSNSLTAVTLEDTNKDFRTFFDKFHSDSLYQIAHIQQPLKGIPAMVKDESLLDGSYIWPMDNWVMHKPFNNIGNEYLREYIIMDKNIIIENIKHKVSGFGMERRFIKENGDWYLNYYAGMNMMN